MNQTNTMNKLKTQKFKMKMSQNIYYKIRIIKHIILR